MGRTKDEDLTFARELLGAVMADGIDPARRAVCLEIAVVNLMEHAADDPEVRALVAEHLPVALDARCGTGLHITAGADDACWQLLQSAALHYAADEPLRFAAVHATVNPTFEHIEDDWGARAAADSCRAWYALAAGRYRETAGIVDALREDQHRLEGPWLDAAPELAHGRAVTLVGLYHLAAGAVASADSDGEKAARHVGHFYAIQDLLGPGCEWTAALALRAAVTYRFDTPAVTIA